MEAVEDRDHDWFELMCRSSPDFMVIIDRERRFRWVNRLLPNLTLDDVIGRPIDDFEAPDTHERSRQATARAFETGEPQTFESHVTQPSGFDAWYEVRCVPVAGHPERLMLLTTDITDRKTAERQRDEYQRQLFQSQKMEAIGRMAGGVAHDFNNLLTPIIGYSEEAMELIGPEHPARELLQGVVDAARRAARLTGDLLTVGAGRPSSARKIDLADTVRGMESMLHRVVPESIELDARVLEPGATVCIDPGQIEQVLLNLVVNAVDAMPSGGRLSLQTSVEGDSAALLVRDTGTGMSAEVLDNAFDPFFTTKGPEGTGLGLATSRSIIEQAGGRIEVTSELGRGTTFRVFLPLVKTDAT